MPIEPSVQTLLATVFLLPLSLLPVSSWTSDQGWITSLTVSLPLDATDDDALDEVSLRDEEEQEDRNEHG